MLKTIAIDCTICRAYHVYIDIPDDATDKGIEKALRDYIVSASSDELHKCEDPGFEIEEDDLIGWRQTGYEEEIDDEYIDERATR